ncbi:hypothetical protein RF11_14587 [Thelohanellus kitauei]|uniref:Uncharacterized protein n=1 Tax=Thelohanellus kitauei TaxID=669202 RepID=A0A0C2MN74_THEKT|nr:hypothetical protein RF11_14587 [Thelohanellus kitauei]
MLFCRFFMCMSVETDSDVEEPYYRSVNTVETEYKNLKEKGNMLKRIKKFRGIAYFEAAEFAALHKKEYTEIVEQYEESAECFLQVKDIRTIICYDNENINKAIERCVVYGYKCESIFGDKNKSSELYQTADELRLKHNIPHICARTRFDQILFEQNTNKVLEDRSKRPLMPHRRTSDRWPFRPRDVHAEIVAEMCQRRSPPHQQVAVRPSPKTLWLPKLPRGAWQISQTRLSPDGSDAVWILVPLLLGRRVGVKLVVLLNPSLALHEAFTSWSKYYVARCMQQPLALLLSVRDTCLVQCILGTSPRSDFPYCSLACDRRRPTGPRKTSSW